MDKDRIFRDLESAIVAKKEAEKQILLAKLKLKYSTLDGVEVREPKKNTIKPKKQNEIEQFITDHYHEMEPETIEFLRRKEVLPQEVSDFLDEIGQKPVGAVEITRRVKRGLYDPGPSNSKGRRVICTLSVVKRIFFPELCPQLTDKKTELGGYSPLSKDGGVK